MGTAKSIGTCAKKAAFGETSSPLPPLRIRVEQLEEAVEEIRKTLDLLSEGLQHLREEVG